VSFKKVLYAGFLKIREIEGLPIQTKHRMLWEMLGMNGQNKDFWRVVGITELAYTKIVENDYKLPKGTGHNKINRSHINDRMATSKVMLEGPLMDIDTWWKFYKNNDVTVLATATENKSKEKEVIKYKVPSGLFETQGFAARVGPEEVEFLKGL
jgi:hypothetical protein